MNGGFGLVLDGSEAQGAKAFNMLNWDVSNGVARRAWSGNANAKETIARTMGQNERLKVTIGYDVKDENILEKAFNKS